MSPKATGGLAVLEEMLHSLALELVLEDPRCDQGVEVAVDALAMFPGNEVFEHDIPVAHEFAEVVLVCLGQTVSRQDLGDVVLGVGTLEPRHLARQGEGKIR